MYAWSGTNEKRTHLPKSSVWTIFQFLAHGVSILAVGNNIFSSTFFKVVFQVCLLGANDIISITL